MPISIPVLLSISLATRIVFSYRADEPHFSYSICMHIVYFPKRQSPKWHSEACPDRLRQHSLFNLQPTPTQCSTSYFSVPGHLTQGGKAAEESLPILWLFLESRANVFIARNQAAIRLWGASSRSDRIQLRLGSGARGENPSKRSTDCLKDLTLQPHFNPSFLVQVATREAAVSRFLPASFVYSPARLFAVSRLTTYHRSFSFVSLQSDTDLI